MMTGRQKRSGNFSQASKLVIDDIATSLALENGGSNWIPPASSTRNGGKSRTK
jgi:hypothetical protein